MSTITKRQLADRILRACNLISMTNGATSDEYQEALLFMEDSILSMTANDGVKIGWKKSGDYDYIDPDAESGVTDGDVLSVVDYIVYFFKQYMGTPLNQSDFMAYNKARKRLLPEIRPKKNQKPAVPSGAGHRLYGNRPSFVVNTPDDNLDLNKAGDLNFGD